MFSFRKHKNKAPKRPEGTVISEPQARADFSQREQDLRSNVTAPPRVPQGLEKAINQYLMDQESRRVVIEDINILLTLLQPNKILFENVDIDKVQDNLSKLFVTLKQLDQELSEKHVPTADCVLYPGHEETKALEEKILKELAIARNVIRTYNDSQSEIQSLNDRDNTQFERRTEASAPAMDAFGDFLGNEEEQMPLLFTGGNAHLHGDKRNSDIRNSRIRFSDRRQEIGPMSTSTPYVGAQTGAIPKTFRGTQEYAKRYGAQRGVMNKDEEINPEDSISAVGGQN